MVSAEEMRQSITVDKNSEFAKLMDQIERRKGYPSGYFYRPGKISEETIAKLEELGFKVVIFCKNRCSHQYCTFVYWLFDDMLNNSQNLWRGTVVYSSK